ncbi:MAG: VOC family protein [Gammaproteobacteria bacterium]|nr:VOC family protein [Gammaproteobacteria bacterium]
MQTAKTPVAVWFELPTTDLARATRFYEGLLATGLKRETMGPIDMAIFPHGDEHCGGALVQGGPYRPGDTGAVVYLFAGPALDPVLARVAALGGQVVIGKTLITPEIGYYAQVRDTEGNVVGLCAKD